MDIKLGFGQGSVSLKNEILGIGIVSEYAASNDMVDENITPDFIIDKIMLMVAKGYKPKSVVLCQELHDLFMYDKHYRLPPLTARPEFFGLPCEIGIVDSFKIII